ncbi:MAG: hypothetical protein AMJ54_09195 [Deltaproteobacteria bacterium SG8_13]|nr:MAG: hypothetical protein AMJ54_09195 [Deltaproteobacteria bacterium SG8_13]
MRRKTICFFNSYRQWGGGEKWNVDMATRLAGRGHAVVVVANRKSELYDRLGKSGVKRLQVGISNLSPANPAKVFQIYRLLQREKIETIILNLSTDVKVAGIAAKLAGLKKILYARGIAKPINNTMANRFLFGRILTGVIANSKETKRAILRNNTRLIDPDHVYVIYNGIDMTRYRIRSRKSHTLRESSEVILGTAGRLETVKNQQFLIRAARLLKDRGVAFKLLIAGEGRLRSELQELAASLGVSEEIRFLGFISDMPEFMAGIDIFVLSSHYEGFGYVLVEAMAAERPVITFDDSSSPEIVEDQKTGILVPRNDLNEFVRQITHIAENRHLITRYGQAGKKRVEAHFTIQQTLEDLEKVI